MRRFLVIAGVVMIIGIIAYVLFVRPDEKKIAPKKLKLTVSMKTHFIMYANSEAEIYSGPGNGFDIVRKTEKDEKLFVDQPVNGWFPVYPVLIDSIKNLEKNRIGYIHQNHLARTSGNLKNRFVTSLRDEFERKNLEVEIMLEKKDSVLVLSSLSFNDTWVENFLKTSTFSEIKDMGFAELIITNTTDYVRSWRFEGGQSAK
jgi:hypothetical protein